jgi:hypothetical protein
MAAAASNKIFLIFIIFCFIGDGGSFSAAKIQTILQTAKKMRNKRYKMRKKSFSKGVNDSRNLSTYSGKRLSTTSGKELKTVNQNQEKTDGADVRNICNIVTFKNSYMHKI